MNSSGTSCFPAIEGILAKSPNTREYVGPMVRTFRLWFLNEDLAMRLPIETFFRPMLDFLKKAPGPMETGLTLVTESDVKEYLYEIGLQTDLQSCVTKVFQNFGYSREELYQLRVEDIRNLATALRAVRECCGVKNCPLVTYAAVREEYRPSGRG